MSKIAPVSVIMPVFNGEKYIKESLQSILDQTIYPSEIVVVNDGSTDGSTAVVQALSQDSHIPIRLISHDRNLGFPTALNTGVTSIKTSLCMFLDSDDLFTPEAVSLLWTCMDTHQVDIVAGQVSQFVCQHATKQFKMTGNDLIGGTIGTLIISKSCFNTVGLFDETLQFGPNIEWMSRAKTKNVRLIELNKLIVCRRLHDFNMSHNKINRSYFLEIAKRNIQRSRNTAS